jgi:ribosomal protein S18 acetylase RimI-like enzyme
MGDLDEHLPLTSRVVVRWCLETPDPTTGATLTDTVGELLSRTEQELTIGTSSGEVVVARDRVVAAKEVPPKPTRTGAPHRVTSVADLQRVVTPSWGAVESESLGGWVLRASSGFTQRGNSVVPLGDPGLPLSSALERVERWYAARGLPAKVTLAGPEGFDPAANPLGAVLVDRGYTVGSRSLTMTAPTDRVASADPGGPEVVIEESLTAGWLQGYPRGEGVDPAVLRAVLEGSPRQLFASTIPGGGLSQQLGLRERGAAGTTPVAVGRLALAHGWAGLGAVRTDPAYRGRGLAAHLTARLARAALDEGVRLVHLQVEADNDTAIRLYERMGFERHSEYVYLTQP